MIENSQQNQQGYMKIPAFLKYNFTAILWSLIILILCGLPGEDFPDTSFWTLLSFDKFAHAFVFGVQVILIIVGQAKQYRFSFNRYKIVRRALIFTIIFGGLVEILQAVLFRGRTGDIMDFIANTIGSVFGVFMFYVIYGKNIFSMKS